MTLTPFKNINIPEPIKAPLLGGLRTPGKHSRR
jgi:hypothetical protein